MILFDINPVDDCERNDGTEAKPYRMSDELKRIVGKANIHVEPEKEKSILGNVDRELIKAV